MNNPSSSLTKIGGGLVERDDAAVGAEGLSEREPDDEGGQDLLSGRAPASHLHLRLVLDHDDLLTEEYTLHIIGYAQDESCQTLLVEASHGHMKSRNKYAHITLSVADENKGSSGGEWKKNSILSFAKNRFWNQTHKGVYSPIITMMVTRFWRH